MEHDFALIMAGGGGTRLWPLSRADMPKQMLPLVEDESMFAVSVHRLAPLYPPDRIYVITGEQYVADLQAQVPHIPAENFIAEPYGKDSGPAALLGMAIIQARDPQATVAILTADHHITDKARFREALAAASDIARSGYIVTLGITPNLPSTAFGYIHRGEKLRSLDGFTAYHALGFKEKPDLARATQFIQAGDYCWNSGMFIWTMDRAMREFATQQPDMYAQIASLRNTIGTPAFTLRLREVWDNIRKISFDYAVMEQAHDVAVIPVDIGWNDIGSWDALYDVWRRDAAGNGKRGAAPECIFVDTYNTLVYSDKLTVAIGVEDMVIVQTDDALLVCHKDHTQAVKEVVNLLKSKQEHQPYL
jgi:mannose-1-phosphate guanylyltransferase